MDLFITRYIEKVPVTPELDTLAVCKKNLPRWISVAAIISLIGLLCLAIYQLYQNRQIKNIFSPKKKTDAQKPEEETPPEEIEMRVINTLDTKRLNVFRIPTDFQRKALPLSNIAEDVNFSSSQSPEEEDPFSGFPLGSL